MSKKRSFYRAEDTAPLDEGDYWVKSKFGSDVPVRKSMQDAIAQLEQAKALTQ